MNNVTVTAADAAVITAVQEAAGEAAVRWFVAGALARMLLEQIHNLPPGRATRDIDIAIQLDGWNTYRAIRESLLASGAFVADRSVEHRLSHTNGRQLDLIPFGAIAVDNKLNWRDGHRMDVSGFTDAYAGALKVIVNQPTPVQIVSAPGLFLLKLIAWNDRHYQHASLGKDAADLAFILRHVESMVGGEVYLHDTYPDVAEHFDYDMEAVACEVLGRQVRELSSDSTCRKITEIVAATERDSALVNEVGRAILGGIDRARFALAAFMRGFANH